MVPVEAVTGGQSMPLIVNGQGSNRRSDDGQLILTCTVRPQEPGLDLGLLVELSGLEPLTSDRKITHPSQAGGSGPRPVIIGRVCVRVVCLRLRERG